MWPHASERRSGVLAARGVDDDPLCRRCDGACCRSFPTVALSAAEYHRLEALGARRLEWTLAGRWYLVIENGCEFQRDDGRCGIYADRPEICRRFVCVR